MNSPICLLTFCCSIVQTVGTHTHTHTHTSCGKTSGDQTRTKHTHTHTPRQIKSSWDPQLHFLLAGTTVCSCFAVVILLSVAGFPGGAAECRESGHLGSGNCEGNCEWTRTPCVVLWQVQVVGGLVSKGSRPYSLLGFCVFPCSIAKGVDK